MSRILSSDQALADILQLDTLRAIDAGIELGVKTSPGNRAAELANLLKRGGAEAITAAYQLGALSASGKSSQNGTEINAQSDPLDSVRTTVLNDRADAAYQLGMRLMLGRTVGVDGVEKDGPEYRDVARGEALIRQAHQLNPSHAMAQAWMDSFNKRDVFDVFYQDGGAAARLVVGPDNSPEARPWVARNPQDHHVATTDEDLAEAAAIMLDLHRDEVTDILKKRGQLDPSLDDDAVKLIVDAALPAVKTKWSEAIYGEPARATDIDDDWGDGEGHDAEPASGTGEPQRSSRHPSQPVTAEAAKIAAE